MVLVAPLVFGLAYADLSDDFMREVESGEIARVKALIKKGADVNSRDMLGVSALMFAIIMDNPEIAKILIDSGAEVNGRDIVGSSALMFAADMGSQAETLHLLISAGADVNARDNMGWTALLLAARSANLDLVKILVKNGARTDAKTESGVTYALAAAQGGLDNIVIDLIEKGENVNQRSSDGFTPLMYAAKNGSEKVVAVLIGKGAGVNTKDRDGNSVLAYAIAGNHQGVMKILKKEGATASFGANEDSVFCKEVTGDIANLAIANESYFAENDKYIVSGDGGDLPMWKPSPGVKIKLGGEAATKFTMLASHPECVDANNKEIVYLWDSSQGGLQ
ncbi:hypothetical protein MNBD_NITROSPINAE02-1660 [hydrothermal vent metagenome]|uniref:Uncharacterized protein n=1 Tax=hydrothermal vent metagenome TaxID=652676 RepID=A0A3B1C752_9ZZZZ